MIHNLLMLFSVGQTSEPMKVIRKMEAVYASLVTYSDQGSVISIFSEKGQPDENDVVTFETHYLRPGKLHFRFLTSYPGELTTFEIVAAGKKKVFKYHGVEGGAWQAADWIAHLGQNGKFEPPIALNDAIASCTGISSCCAYTVPTMLFPGGSGLYFHQMSDSKILGTEVIDNHPCYRFSSLKYREQFWIDCKSLLLRKIVEETDLGADPAHSNAEQTCEATTYYQPDINGKIDAKSFIVPTPTVHH